ncbi:response regulator [Thermosynechococcaceae cyanobacterium BACA0444]|uniref:Circadian input-output histidine kinase CikA n=1 Tax=Pseudocalidococcus azoricus BACA0444 TaxID=2918990 RepID=A0AAE4FQN2_9CYAN|nr:response regulator [Pseudocalidococcus azoricus]MDS3859191.1 response regulator [Pseudocalidococcus azoricus BACA0444]
MRQKTLAITGATLVGLVSIIYGISVSVLNHNIHADTQARAKRGADAIFNLVELKKEDFTRDFQSWSAWDETYQFVLDGNLEYLQANLIPDTYKNLDINLIAIVNREGELVYGGTFYSNNINVQALPKDFLPYIESGRLMAKWPGDRHVGLIHLREGVLLFTAQPILNSQNQGPVRGTAIYGQFLDSRFSQRISHIIQAPVTLIPIASGLYLPDFSDTENRVREQYLDLDFAHPVITPLKNGDLATYVFLMGINQKPAAILRLEVSPSIPLLAEESRWVLVGASGGVGLIFGAIMLLLLERLVLARLSTMSAGVSQIRRSGDVCQRLPVRGGDELSALERNINGMLAALESSQKQLTQALQVKTSFMATMSHEIRTPLNAIVGMTGLLLETRLDTEQRDYVETVRLGSENLLTVINEILDFSKLEAHEMQLEMVNFNLQACVDEVVDLLAGNAHRKNLELAALVEYDVPAWLKGDESRLRQVLVNLVNNALKFTSAGEVVIRVRSGDEMGQTAFSGESTPEAVPPTTLLRFTVEDTGIGIPAAALPKLFQPFTQVDASTTRKYGGTGLGLAICRQIVEMMGGQIGVESTEGVGSCFWFEIPFPLGTAADPLVAPPGLVGKRVLLVDDNQTNLDISRYHLRHWGLEVLTAMSAHAALEVLNSNHASGQGVDLALLDMQMPDVDGLTLGRQIRQLPLAQTIPLVMLTSLGPTDPQCRAEFDAYLVKPVRPSRLFNTLVALLTPPAAPSAPPIPEVLITPSESSLRILVAEDNVTNQKVALRQLKNLGYGADVVSNGLEAVLAWETVGYDLIFMDCQMPEMDGFEATRQIRAKEQRTATHVPIIALTANAMPEDRQRCYGAGMDDYLSKPVRKQDLAAKLQQWGQRPPLDLPVQSLFS